MLFVGPDKLSQAAEHFNLSYKSPEEMLSKWETTVMPLETAMPSFFLTKGFAMTLRNIFQRVKAESLRDIFVMMGHEQQEALATNFQQLLKAIIAHIMLVSFATSLLANELLQAQHVHVYKPCDIQQTSLVL